jgi:hypothetical protein
LEKCRDDNPGKLLLMRAAEELVNRQVNRMVDRPGK